MVLARPRGRYPAHGDRRLGRPPRRRRHVPVQLRPVVHRGHPRPRLPPGPHGVHHRVRPAPQGAGPPPRPRPVGPGPVGHRPALRRDPVAGARQVPAGAHGAAAQLRAGHRRDPHGGLGIGAAGAATAMVSRVAPPVSIAGTLRTRPAAARDSSGTPPGVQGLWVVLGIAAAAAVAAFALLAVRRATYPYPIAGLGGGPRRPRPRIPPGGAPRPPPPRPLVRPPPS